MVADHHGDLPGEPLNVLLARPGRVVGRVFGVRRWWGIGNRVGRSVRARSRHGTTARGRSRRSLTAARCGRAPGLGRRGCTGRASRVAGSIRTRACTIGRSSRGGFARLAGGRGASCLGLGAACLGLGLGSAHRVENLDLDGLARTGCWRGRRTLPGRRGGSWRRGGGHLGCAPGRDVGRDHGHPGRDQDRVESEHGHHAGDSSAARYRQHEERHGRRTTAPRPSTQPRVRATGLRVTIVLPRARGRTLGVANSLGACRVSWVIGDRLATDATETRAIQNLASAIGAAHAPGILPCIAVCATLWQT